MTEQDLPICEKELLSISENPSAFCFKSFLWQNEAEFCWPLKLAKRLIRVNRITVAGIEEGAIAPKDVLPATKSGTKLQDHVIRPLLESGYLRMTVLPA